MKDEGLGGFLRGVRRDFQKGPLSLIPLYYSYIAAINIYIYIFISIYLDIYIYIYIYICICIYMYIYIYIHTLHSPYVSK